MLTMLCNSRRFVRVIKYLLAGVTVFCVSWIACVNEWNGSIRWTRRNSGVGKPLTTMRTIVAYSEGKQAELDRPSPVTCDRLPAFPGIMQINRTWSPDVYESKWQHVPGTRVSLYAAYYDERQSQHYVRILAAFHGRNISTEEQLYCQTRSSNPYENSVEVVAAKPLEIWWHEWDPSSPDIETPLLLSCPLIEPLYGPLVVSVVTEPCNNPTNAFTLESHRKINNYSRKFTICVKDMNFEKDVSQNIVEWIEINKILGVEIIDVYVDKINKEIENVLTYYRNEGVLRLFHVPIKYKPNRTLWQRRRDHVLTYNDCLYRNIRESEYVIPLDIDEIILPKIANNWFDLLTRLSVHGWDPKENSAIMIQNVFFFEFLQDINKFKHKNVHNEHKIYTKRDDVRIRVRDDLDLGEIELIGNVKGVESAIIDYKDSDKYKSRCKKVLTVPKLARHLVRSAVISPMGYYSKSWMVTKKVLTAFNHYPLASLGAMNFAGWSAPFGEVQLNHYKESCNTTVVGECALYGRRALFDTAALRLRNKLTRALANGYCTGIKNT